MKIERLFDLLLRYISHFPTEEVLCSKKYGIWKKYGIEEIVELVDLLSIGFLKSGVKKGDKIAIVSANRPEWNIVDFACQQVGAISVPIYTNFSTTEISSILQDIEVRYIFVSDHETVRKVKTATDTLLYYPKVYSFDYVQGTKHWSTFRSLAKPADKDTLERSKRNIKGDDVVSVIFTSGTTGKPKGVVLTHNNIISNVLSLSEIIPLEPGAQCRILSFLPLSHMFERSAIYMYLYFGCHIFYAESSDTIPQNLQEVRPYSFTAIPNDIEKLYKQVMKQAHTLKGVEKALFYWAFKLALRYDTKVNRGWWYSLQKIMAREFVLKRFRNHLGGNIKYIISGAASLEPKLCRLFWASKIKILEGYGMTEASPAISLSHPEDTLIGSAGRPLEGVSVKIADDGEILVKGPNIMKGYYQNVELTHEAIDAHGWLHTGDIGEIVEGGYLKIKHRKKEIFQTFDGKYFALQELENRFKESDLIEQILVVGENKTFASALIVPGKEAVEYLCEQHKIPFTNLREILKHPEVKQKFYHEFKKHNSISSNFPKIKKFLILPDSWGIQTGELTPTMKVKRQYILNKYQRQIAKLYL